MNKHWTFDNPGEHYTFGRYVILSTTIVAANSLLMHLLVDVWGGSALVMKIIVECLLYVVSFTVQNNMALGTHRTKKKS
jgi:putative flippase GtrA